MTRSSNFVRSTSCFVVGEGKDISNMTQDAKSVHMSNKVFCRGPEGKSIAMTQHVNFLHMLNQPYGFEGSRGGKFSKWHHVVTFRIQWTYCFVGSRRVNSQQRFHVSTFFQRWTYCFVGPKKGINWKIGNLRNDSSWELPPCVQDIVFVGEGGWQKMT